MYRQVFGAPMGALMSPRIIDLTKEDFEEVALSAALHNLNPKL